MSTARRPSSQRNPSGSSSLEQGLGNSSSLLTSSRQNAPSIQLSRPRQEDSTDSPTITTAEPGSTLKSKMDPSQFDTLRSTDSPTISSPVHFQPSEPMPAPSVRPPSRTPSLHSNRSPVGILRRLSSLTIPKKPVGPTPTVAASLKAIVLSSWLNLLLVFIPVSWTLHYTIHNDTAIFVTCFFAIIPLAKLLGFATEELALRVGQTLGGLLNATLGNAVELIISIIALIKCELRVVQASLVGSILSNLLLVLGMCFFAGGTRFSEQGFMLGASQLNSSLLTVSVVAVLIPATFHAAIGANREREKAVSIQEEGTALLRMSHGVAIILLFIYGAMLFFQLWSHAHLYDEKGQHAETPAPSIRYPPRQKKIRKEKEGKENHPFEQGNMNSSDTHVATTGSVSHLQVITDLHSPTKAHEEEEEIPQISVMMAVVLLVVVTVLIAFTAEFLVDSIGGLVENSPISEEWVGLILIPIVGNAAEHLTAVTVSVKDKLDLSIGVAVGSSIQISLLVIPLIVVLGWILDKPLTLLFDPFESVVLFLSVITVNYVVADGKSNWLEGMVLMSLYVLIATALWFYPGSDPAAALLTCR